MILRASHLRNWACDIGDFAMAMMGNGLVMGGRDGYYGLSRIQREWLRKAERIVGLDFLGFDNLERQRQRGLPRKPDRSIQRERD